MEKLNVLITGAAQGIGKAVSDYFLNEGHNVYGLDILKFEDDRVKSFKCDITSNEDLNNVKSYLKENNIKLDAILNFAGIHMMGSFVESDFNKIKKLMDINLSGTMLVNNILYECLKEKGRILITTSEVASLDPMPFNGIYNVSKTALDCYAQSLRQELNLKGQKVITLRPGAIATKLAKGSLDATQKLCDETILFKNESKHFMKLVKNFMGTPLEANKLAKLVYKITIKKHPKYIYSKHRNIGLVLLNILPKRWQCGIIKMLLK